MTLMLTIYVVQPKCFFFSFSRNLIWRDLIGSRSKQILTAHAYCQLSWNRLHLIFTALYLATSYTLFRRLFVFSAVVAIFSHLFIHSFLHPSCTSCQTGQWIKANKKKQLSNYYYYNILLWSKCQHLLVPAVHICCFPLSCAIVN